LAHVVDRPRLVCRSAGADRAHPGRRGRQLAPVPSARAFTGITGLIPRGYSRGSRTQARLHHWPGPEHYAGDRCARVRALGLGSAVGDVVDAYDSGFGAQVVVVALESNDEPMTVIFRASSVELAA
jgi:hypothetical protein